jgi:hypothetical protein
MPSDMTIIQLFNLTKRDKVKKVFALINELHIQDSGGSDEQVDDIPISKTAMVRKLAQIPPEILMTFYRCKEMITE